MGRFPFRAVWVLPEPEGVQPARVVGTDRYIPIPLKDAPGAIDRSVFAGAVAGRGAKEETLGEY